MLDTHKSSEHETALVYFTYSQILNFRIKVLKRAMSVGIKHPPKYYTLSLPPVMIQKTKIPSLNNAEKLAKGILKIIAALSTEQIMLRIPLYLDKFERI